MGRAVREALQVVCKLRGPEHFVPSGQSRSFNFTLSEMRGPLQGFEEKRGDLTSL